MKRKHKEDNKDSDVEHSVEEDVENDGVEDDTEDPEQSTSSLKPDAPEKKKKRGIIYLSTIPKHMTVSIARDMFSQYADVGRMFFQPSAKSKDGKLTVIDFLIYP